MRSRNGKRLQTGSQIREHLSTMPNGQAAFLRGAKFDVVLEDSSGDNDDIGAVIFADACDIGGIVADINGHARLAKLLRITAVADVGTRDDKTLIVGDLGDTAHANTTDADEMNRRDFIHVHAQSLSNAAFMLMKSQTCAQSANARRS